MKKLIILLLGILLASCVSPSQQQTDLLMKISELESVIERQKVIIAEREKENLLPTEFQNLEKIDQQRFENALSTVDIVNATSDSVKDYDKLLNKFYQELLAKTEKEDTEIIREAQRNWIKFRDAEIELNNLLSEDKYSGGTIQLLINGSNYLNLVKERALQIYNHKERIRR